MTDSRVTVRPARPEDAAAVARLLAGGSIRANEDPSDPEPYRAAIAHARNGLVAEIDGEVVGVCQLIIFRHLQEQGGLCAEIESMHVDRVPSASEGSARCCSTRRSNGPERPGATGCS